MERAVVQLRRIPGDLQPASPRVRAADLPRRGDPRRPGGLLEGSYPDRRMVTFDSLDDVAAKRPRLEAAIREWIDIRDREAESP